jgi:hypothetical protein
MQSGPLSGLKCQSPIALCRLGALLIMQAMKSLLWQVTAKDAAAFIASAALISGISLAAICGPPCRMHITPSQKLGSWADGCAFQNSSSIHIGPASREFVTAENVLFWREFLTNK